MKIELNPIENIPLIKENDDISELIIKNDADIQNDDIYIIASTIIAKAQGRNFKLGDLKPSKNAIEIAEITKKDPRFVEAILQESTDVLIKEPFILVRTINGNICINAGIDGSNVEEDFYIYLPKNPNKEAKIIGKKIEEKKDKCVSIIITDTNGRAFRNGQCSIAIGIYGIKPLLSWIGKKDLFDYTLKVSEEAIVDEIASAANLLMGEGNNGFPIIKLRGLHLYTQDEVDIAEIYRDEKKDLIIQNIKK